MRKKLLSLGLVGALYAALFSTQTESSRSPETRLVNGNRYELSNDSIKQLDEDLDKTARFGIIADPHGCHENVKTFAEHFKEEKLDGIIMLGDYASFRIEKNLRFTPYEGITKCLEEAAKTGLPVYVIPGNHELEYFYKKAINELSQKYKNVFDMTVYKTVDGDDFDLIANTLGYDYFYTNDFVKPSESDKDSFKAYAKQLQNDDDPEILVTHRPPKCEGVNGVDYRSDCKNVGDVTLDKLMRELSIRFSLSAHVHGAGGKAINENSEIVPENLYSPVLRYNPGAACPTKYRDGKESRARAGILTIENKNAKYQDLNL